MVSATSWAQCWAMIVFPLHWISDSTESYHQLHTKSPNLLVTPLPKHETLQQPVVLGCCWVPWWRKAQRIGHQSQGGRFLSVWPGACELFSSSVPLPDPGDRHRLSAVVLPASLSKQRCRDQGMDARSHRGEELASVSMVAHIWNLFAACDVKLFSEFLFIMLCTFWPLCLYKA